MAESKRLYRSTTDKQVAGVCGGLGKYLEIDPTIIRLAFLALLVFGGQGLLLYFILAIVIPEEPMEYTYSTKRKREPETEFDDSDSINGSGAA
jgi:phage shock protein C